MKINLKAPVSTVVAVLSGVLLLVALAFNLSGLRGFLLNWVMVAAAAALLLGVANLGMVHVDKVRQGQNRLYSLALLVSLALTFGVTLWYGPRHQLPQWIFENVQLPVEASLAAVMTVSLALALMRLIRRRPDLNSMLFVLFAVLALVSSAPFFGLDIPLLSTGLRGFVQLIANAGARGILIGVAIGTVATGLRILLGADRPYGG